MIPATDPTVPPGQSSVQVELPAGTLTLEVEACQGVLADLLGFAARDNPRRAFLFLSKVLGKHYPARPSAMLAVHQALADSVADEGGPVVFVGMAETATGLGQGVFEAWLRANPGRQALYLQTTRYRSESAACLTFEESHSHAPRVFLHLPDGAGDAVLRSARQLVLVDDELSTGNTFVNLVAVLRPLMPALAAVHLATISDFIGAQGRSALGLRMGVACSIGAMLRGCWQFEPRATATLSPNRQAQCAEGEEVCLSDTGYGRLGRSAPVALPAALLERLVAESPDGPTLVLGTGEFMHAAFVLAQALELAGADVRVQASTRSPILCWGAVGHVVQLPDPYGEDIANYLYNVQPGQYARVLICHETGPGARLREMARILGGRLIHFKPCDHAEEIPVC